MILVDTHVVVWLAFDQGQLSKNARAAINEARQNGEGLAISDITLLELTSKGRIRLDISLESFLREIEARFIVLPISGRACVRALGLPTTQLGLGRGPKSRGYAPSPFIVAGPSGCNAQAAN